MALVITVIRWDIKRSSYFIPSPVLRARPDDVTPLCGSLLCSASTGVHKELLSPADFPSLHHLWLLQLVGSQSHQKKASNYTRVQNEEAWVLTLLISQMQATEEIRQRLSHVLKDILYSIRAVFVSSELNHLHHV